MRERERVGHLMDLIVDLNWPTAATSLMTSCYSIWVDQVRLTSNFFFIKLSRRS